jgi:phosphoglycolate phosphatase
VFDLDGTLVDVRERHYRTYQATVAAFQGRPLDPAGYWRLKRRGLGWAGLLDRSGLPAGIEDAFLERFVAGIEDPEVLGLDRLFPGVPGMLAALGRRGDRLVLVSLRRSAAGFRRQLAGLGIGAAFELACAGHAHASGHLDKIDLIRLAGCGPPAAVVGDTEADVLAAHALGLRAIGVASGLRSRGYLERAGAEVVLARVTQLPAALAAR